jgi:sorting nexin-25
MKVVSFAVLVSSSMAIVAISIFICFLPLLWSLALYGFSGGLMSGTLTSIIALTVLILVLNTGEYKSWYFDSTQRPNLDQKLASTGEIPVWLQNFFESFSKAHLHVEIESVHSSKGVQDALLQLETILIELYVQPWFSRLTTPNVEEHVRNPIPLYAAPPPKTLTNHNKTASFDRLATSHISVIPESEFIASLRFYVRSIILAVKIKVEKVDWSGFILENLVPLLTQHIHDFQRAREEVSQVLFSYDFLSLTCNQGNRSLTASEELDLYTASFFRQGKLHPALGVGDSNTSNPKKKHNSNTKHSLSMNTVETENEYLRGLMDDYLPRLFPSEQKSKLLHYLVREILVVFVLQPILSLLAEPDFWNQNIDLFASNAIKEQKMVNKLREALEKPFSESKNSSLKRKSTKKSAPSFDKYLVMIKQCDNLIDAKRLQHSILSEIHRKSLQTNGKDDKDVVNGRRVVEIKRYIARLKTAQKKISKKILHLGGSVSANTEFHSSIPLSKAEKGSNDDYSDVMQLIEEPALSYYREFLEKNGEIDVLQFYCAINALTTQISEATGKTATNLYNISSLSFEDQKILRQDVVSLYNSYLIQPSGNRRIIEKLDIFSDDAQSLFYQIEAANIASEVSITAALDYLRTCQVKARNYLQMFTVSFQQSDLFFRFLSDPSRSVSKHLEPKPMTLSRRASHLIKIFRKDDSQNNPPKPVQQIQTEISSVSSELPVPAIILSPSQPQEESSSDDNEDISATGAITFSDDSSDASSSYSVGRVQKEIENILEESDVESSYSEDLDFSDTELENSTNLDDFDEVQSDLEGDSSENETTSTFSKLSPQEQVAFYHYRSSYSLASARIRKRIETYRWQSC